MHKINTSYTLNLYSIICHSYLNKAGGILIFLITKLKYEHFIPGIKDVWPLGEGVSRSGVD